MADSFLRGTFSQSGCTLWFYGHRDAAKTKCNCSHCHIFALDRIVYHPQYSFCWWSLLIVCVICALFLPRFYLFCCLSYQLSLFSSLRVSIMKKNCFLAVRSCQLAKVVGQCRSCVLLSLCSVMVKLREKQKKMGLRKGAMTCLWIKLKWMKGEALSGQKATWRGKKKWMSLERMPVQPLLLLESGWKVGPWTYPPKLTAQKLQLMYSSAVGLCCAASKRSCCAVRLLISLAPSMGAHALTLPRTRLTQGGF